MGEHEVEGECPWKAGLFSATLISIALLQAVCVQKHTGDFTLGPPPSSLTYRWLRKTSSTGQKNVSDNEGKHVLVTENRRVLKPESITFTTAIWRVCRALPIVFRYKPANNGCGHTTEERTWAAITNYRRKGHILWHVDCNRPWITSRVQYVPSRGILVWDPFKR